LDAVELFVPAPFGHGLLSDSAPRREDTPPGRLRRAREAARAGAALTTVWAVVDVTPRRALHTEGIMPAPACPQCGAQTRFGGYEPWCPACGWNREVAAARLRRPSRAIPFFYLISVVMF